MSDVSESRHAFEADSADSVDQLTQRNIDNKLKSAKKINRLEAFVKKVGIISVILMLTSGCVVVGGYSSGRGWFLWPGTIVIFLVFALLFLMLRRRG